MKEQPEPVFSPHYRLKNARWAVKRKISVGTNIYERLILAITFILTDAHWYWRSWIITIKLFVSG